MVKVMVQFRGEPELVQSYWCGKFHGWMDWTEKRKPPRIRHDGMGWHPLPPLKADFL